MNAMRLDAQHHNYLTPLVASLLHVHLHGWLWDAVVLSQVISQEEKFLVQRFINPGSYGGNRMTPGFTSECLGQKAHSST